MADLRRIGFTTFNLYNLNLPGLPMYRSAGWTQAEYDRKIAWTARMLQTMRAEVFGFQELWHPDAVKAALEEAKLADDYTILVPAGHAGGKIVCGAAVKTELLDGDPEWIADFPEGFKLSAKGDDAQTPRISVAIKGFSRPVLHFAIKPRAGAAAIQVYVCHLKSKLPDDVRDEPWFAADPGHYGKHAEAIGSALATVRRTAEAAALRYVLVERMKGNSEPVVVLGDLNDGQLSNTLNIVTGQPAYLVGLSTGGGDTDFYAAQTLQEYRSSRDVYFTHIHNDMHESLDHILVSRELYDNSKNRVWTFDGMDVCNDHLNDKDHKDTGTGDHGIVRACFKFAPA